MVIFIIFLLAISIIITVINGSTNVENFESKKGHYVLKNNENLYDKFYANIYDQLSYDKGKNKYELDEITNICKLDKKSNILDIGCGTGHHVGAFIKEGFQAMGIDKSPSMLEVAKKNYPDGKFKLADAEKNIVFNENMFSHITCFLFYNILCSK